LFDDARDWLHVAGDVFGLAVIDLREGLAASYNGETRRAYELSHRALTCFRNLGDQGLLVLSLMRVGECANACGYTDEASAMLEEALARNQGLPGVGRQSLLVSRLALVRLRQGRPTEALELAEQAVALARRQSWGFMTAMALHSRGRTLVAIGRPG